MSIPGHKYLTQHNKLIMMIITYSYLAQGENIFYQWSSRAIPEGFLSYKTAVDDWYKEIDLYDWSNPGFG